LEIKEHGRNDKTEYDSQLGECKLFDEQLVTGAQKKQRKGKER